MNENELQEALAAAKQQIAELKDQVAIAAMEDHSSTSAAFSRLQGKCNRQAVALERLNRRVLNQRFQLRVLNEMGRGLTREEWQTAKEQLDNPWVAERLEYA